MHDWRASPDPTDDGSYTRSAVAASQKRSDGVQRRIVFLDYLRIYAFLAVLAWHKLPRPALIETASPNWLTNSYNALVANVWNGITGVNVFFLVSGYIIAHIILRETTASFLVKRIFRIYPLFCVAVVMQLVVANRIVPTWGVLWPHLTLLGDFLGTSNVLGGIDWTLRIEIVFYGYMAMQRFIFPRASLAIALPIMAAVGALGCVYGPKFPQWNPQGIGALNDYFPVLLLGSCVYLRERFPTHIVPAIVGMGLLILKAAMLPAILIFTVAFLANDLLVSTALTTWLSDMSYGIYLFHNWFYDFVEWHFPKQWPSALRVVPSMILLFAVCHVLMVTIEKPMMARGHRLARALNKAIDTFGRPWRGRARRRLA